MKPKTLLLMVLAVACGLGASFMTSRLLAERQDTQEEKVTILVAKKNLDMGLVIKIPRECFQEKKVSKDDAPKNAIVEPEKVEAELEKFKNRQMKITRRSGDPITQEDLYEQGNSGVAGQLPKNLRAIGLRVNMETGSGGFACLPGSRVDIISTIRRGNDKDSFSQVLLEDVLVLAADTKSQRDENSQAMPATVVTVALSPEDLLKVNIARELGPLSLALRPFGDTRKSNIGKVTMENILNGSSGSRDDDPETPPSIGRIAEPPLPKVGGQETPKTADAGNSEAPKTAPQVAATPKKGEPNGHHRITVIEGDRQRYADYTLDAKTGQVIQHDVIRSELSPSRPVPGTPAPAIAVPATPAPATTAPATTAPGAPAPGTSAPPATPAPAPGAAPATPRGQG